VGDYRGRADRTGLAHSVSGAWEKNSQLIGGACLSVDLKGEGVRVVPVRPIRNDLMARRPSSPLDWSMRVGIAWERAGVGELTCGGRGAHLRWRGAAARVQGGGGGSSRPARADGAAGGGRERREHEVLYELLVSDGELDRAREGERCCLGGSWEWCDFDGELWSAF
jgi:hypothetical protein